MIESGFWFLLGFIVASWMAYRAQRRLIAKRTESFQAAKEEVLRLLESMKELTEVRVTIRDETGELIVETEEDPAPPGKPPRKDLH